MRIGVIGPGGGGATDGQLHLAERVGELLAETGATLVCGGLGGVMEAACRGARSRDGITVGLLPGFDATGANAYLTVALPTGLGEMRNALIVNAAEAVICVGGSWGTLSEVALAMKAGKPCVGLDCWAVIGEDRSAGGRLVVAGSAEEAVAYATAEAARRRA